MTSYCLFQKTLNQSSNAQSHFINSYLRQTENIKHSFKKKE